MARVAAFGRRLAALPGRARLALAAAVVLTLAAVLLVVLPGTGDDGAEPPPADDGDAAMTSTTLNAGGIEVDAPEGWQPIPVPQLGFGVAVPPGWEATLLSPEGLSTLANASPVVPGFVDSAHAAASAGGVLYAAGQDQAGGVSDLMVRAAPQTGVTDVAGLEAYAGDLAAGAGRTDPQVEVVEGAASPTVRLSFQVGAGGEVAEGAETLVLAPDGLVWSVIVTSDDPAIHDELADSLTDTLTFAAG
jgi:hypothetical protein